MKLVRPVVRKECFIVAVDHANWFKYVIGLMLQ